MTCSGAGAARSASSSTASNLPEVAREGPTVQISANTRRALSLPRPRTRGLSHLVAAVLSGPAAVWLTASAPVGQERVAAAVFGLSITAMFSASAAVHLRRWSPRTTEVLFRLDHTTIFLAFGGTATAVAVLGLAGWHEAVLLWGVWGGVLLSTAIVWWPRATPRGFPAVIGFGLGCIPIVVLPELHRQTGGETVGLLFAGGVLFAVGAIIVGLRRPDPNPRVFGYHEVWHLFVIAGVVLYYMMVARMMVPEGGAA